MATHPRKTPVDPNHSQPQPGFESEPEPALTNRDHPTTPGARTGAPGAGVIDTGADVRGKLNDPDGAERRKAEADAAGAPNVAENAQRPGTTEGRAATTARRGVGGEGLERMEAPSTGGQTALNPPNPGTAEDGRPLPGASGIRETSDPNYTAASQDRDARKRKGKPGS